MIKMVNPWTPLFVRPEPRMGQQLTPLVPPAAPPSPMAALGAGVAVLALSSVTVLFSYGIARESKSKLVKTTGYILAGVGALAAAAEALGIGMAVSKSA
jgi:hypothetical protein